MHSVETKNEALCLHARFGRCALTGNAEACPYGAQDWECLCSRYIAKHGDIEEQLERKRKIYELQQSNYRG